MYAVLDYQMLLATGVYCWSEDLNIAQKFQLRKGFAYEFRYGARRIAVARIEVFGLSGSL